MRLNLNILFIFFLSIFLITGSIYSVCAEEEKVRAKIGIQIKSGDRIVRAKSNDRLKKGDLLRIYLHPEEASHVYIVHTDLKNVTFLNEDQQKIQSSTLMMPSPRDYYEVDGESSTETITIIVSPNEVPELLKKLEQQNKSYAGWLEYENILIEKGKIDLSTSTVKPFPMAGNVRGLPGASDIDPFMKELQIFSGKSILVKKYEFKVKK